MSYSKLSCYAYGYITIVSLIALQTAFIISKGKTYPSESSIIHNQIRSFAVFASSMGAIVSGFLLNKMDRRVIIMISCLFLFVPLCFQIINIDSLLTLGRCLECFCGGMNTAVVLVVIKELVPSNQVGYAMSMTCVCFPIGHFFSFLVSYLQSSSNINEWLKYRITPFAEAGINLLVLLLLFVGVTSEPPRYLAMTRREEEAIEVLGKMYREKKERDSCYSELLRIAEEAKHTVLTYKDLLKKPYFYPFIVCFFLMLIRNMAGYIIYVTWSLEVLQITTYETDVFGMMLSGMSILFTIGFVFALNTMPRGWNVMLGSIILTITNVGLLFSVLFGHNMETLEIFKLLMVAINTSAFWFSLGGMAFIYCVEVLTGNGIAAIMGWYWFSNLLIGIPFALFLGKSIAQWARVLYVSLFCVFSVLGILIGIYGIRDTRHVEEKDILALYQDGIFTPPILPLKLLDDKSEHS